MRFNYIKMVAILISFALFVFISMPASAVVMQSSSSALRNDMFVKGSSKKKTNKNVQFSKKQNFHYGKIKSKKHIFAIDIWSTDSLILEGV